MAVQLRRDSKVPPRTGPRAHDDHFARWATGATASGQVVGNDGEGRNLDEASGQVGGTVVDGRNPDEASGQVVGNVVDSRNPDEASVRSAVIPAPSQQQQRTLSRVQETLQSAVCRQRLANQHLT